MKRHRQPRYLGCYHPASVSIAWLRLRIAGRNQRSMVAGRREIANVEKGVDSPANDRDRAPPFVAGWSSLVARQAHNLKVVSSNLTPAPNLRHS